MTAAEYAPTHVGVPEHPLVAVETAHLIALAPQTPKHAGPHDPAEVAQMRRGLAHLIDVLKEQP